MHRFLTVAPGVKLTSPSLLTFGPPASTATVRLGARPPLKSFVGPFFAQKGNALLDDVQLGGVVWTAGENPPGRVLMSAGEVVLISEEDDGTLHLNLEVSRSNVQRTVAWPVLMSNVVRQARLSTPGFPRKHLMLGEDTPLVASPGSTWELEAPDGQSRPVMGSGVLTLPPLSAAGRWKLKKDGEPFDALVVLPLDPRESDLRTRGAWEVIARAAAGLRFVRHRPPAPVVAAAGGAGCWCCSTSGSPPLPAGRRRPRDPASPPRRCCCCSRSACSSTSPPASPARRCGCASPW